VGSKGMNKGSGKVNRARRNALRSLGLVAGAVVSASALPKAASAFSICDIIPSFPGCKPSGGGGSGGGDSGGGGSCFARGTLIRTREGYRPIESLAAGDEVAVRFQGFATIKAMVSHTAKSVPGKWDGGSNQP